MIKFEGKYPVLKDMLNGTLSEVVPSKLKKEYRDIYLGVTNFADKAMTGNGGTGLYLYGINGGGKTWVGTAVLNAMLDRYPGVKKRAYDVIDDYCEHWRIPNLYRTVPVMFIDEFGKELAVKKNAGSIMERILKWRFEHGAITIMASNMSDLKLQEKYGETVVSLIKGRCKGIQFPDIDLRQAIKEFSKIP